MSEQKKNARLFIISGPSGSGKTSLVREVVKRLSPSHNIERIVTYTSRSPRNNEVNGTDYHFLSSEEFSKKASNGDFLESSQYTSGQYASPRATCDRVENGTSCILVVDRDGAKSIAKEIRDCVRIWINAPSLESLKTRLKKRETENATQIEKRLQKAAQEIDEEAKHRHFTYHVTNDIFDDSVNALCSIIEDEMKSS